jgi:uncharacterized protein
VRLTRRGRRSFEPIAAAARNVVVAARLNMELYDRFPESGERVALIRETEQEGDRITAGMHRALTKALLTPVDREDMLAVATALDDVCDDIEDCANALELYAVHSVPERAREQARLLLLACERLSDAAERLWRLPDLSTEVADVFALEDEGDRTRRDALARLFAGGADPLDVVRTKSLHDGLERALDSTKAAAQAMQSLVVQHR